MSLKNNAYFVSAYEACVDNYNEALSYGTKIQTSLLKLDTIQGKVYHTVDELKTDLVDIQEDAIQMHEYIHRLAERYGRLLNTLKPIIETDTDII